MMTSNSVDTRVSMLADDVMAKAMRAFESFGKEVEHVVNTLLIKVFLNVCIQLIHPGFVRPSSWHKGSAKQRR